MAIAEFARACPFPAPEPLFVAAPGYGYPLPWFAQTWLDGETCTPRSCARASGIAHDLVELISALRRHPTHGRRFRGSGRGGDLTDHDDWIDECIRRSAGDLDTASMRALWAEFRVLPREEPDVMCHTDLTPGNLLVAEGRLSGVLDTGGFQPADPALDLVAAWHLFDHERRELVRTGLECNDLQWERGRAWAFEQAAGAYWYYKFSNPGMAELGRTTLRRLATEG